VVRRLSALGAALVVAAAGSGAVSAAQKPAAVVRAWSAALNANRNGDAARLFAPNAHIVQPGVDIRLATRAIAVGFNNALPCAGKITRLEITGSRVVATFVLAERPRHRCDAPGVKAAALFDVRNGKIVLWQQVAVPEDKLPAA
jgi:limonene-1,2-epoxide hydrolase